MSSPESWRVATRWLERHAAASSPLTLPWLKKALAFMVARNSDETSEWAGSWLLALREVEHILRRGLEEMSMNYGHSMTVEDLLARFEDRLDPELVAVFQKAMPPPRPPRPEKPVGQAELDAATEAVREVLPGSVQVYWLRDPMPGEHGPYIKSTLGLVRTIKAVRAKYPGPWKVLGRGVKKVVLQPRPSGTAEASYFDNTVTFNFKSGQVVLVSPSVLVHELGHAFQDLQPDSSQIDRWEALYGNPPFSHSYMETRSVEDFAECFRMYFEEPTLLKSGAPAKYMDMSERVRRV